MVLRVCAGQGLNRRLGDGVVAVDKMDEAPLDVKGEDCSSSRALSIIFSAKDCVFLLLSCLLWLVISTYPVSFF